MDGTPTVLISPGQPDEAAMRRARVDVNDVLASVRASQGLERLDQLKFAVLEIDGSISIVPAER